MNLAPNHIVQRIWSLPVLAAVSGAGALVCLASTYVQWNVNRTCVTPGVCLVEGYRPDGSPICKDLTCGFPVWVFAAPAAVLVAATTAAVVALVLRRGRGRAELA